MKSKSLIHSFKYAFRGIFSAFKTERNMKVHTIVMLIVIIMGILLKISKIEWIICIFSFVMVIGAEIFNTAIEETVNLASPKINEIARISKDLAAGAVLTFAIGSFIIGCIIFLPKLIIFFS